jgi:hypothetical protein
MVVGEGNGDLLNPILGSADNKGITFKVFGQESGRNNEGQSDPATSNEKRSESFFSRMTLLFFKHIEPHLYKPLNVTIWAFVIAWIYTIIPVNNYFIFSLVKNQYWVILVTIFYNEIYNNNLPDIPDSLYILSYVVGVLIAPIFHIVVWIYNMQNSFVLATVATIVALAWAWFIFGLDCLRYPRTARQERLLKKLERRRELGLSVTEVKDWAVMFVATGVCDDPAIMNHLSLISGTSSMVGSISTNTLSFFSAENFAVEKRVVNVGGGRASLSTLQQGDDVEEGIESHHVNNRGVVDYKHMRKRSMANTVVRSQFFCIDCIDSIFAPKYFWFLPRYWDTNVIKKYGELSPNANRAWMWLACSIFLTVCSCDYLFLIFFTEYFLTEELTEFQRVALFSFYIGSNTVFRVIMKTLGMYLDRHKNKSCSMFFVGEFTGLMFYYTFYRVLFESVRSVPEFIGLQCLHLLSEWILYVLRASEWYFNTVEGLSNIFWKCLLPQPRIPHRDWQQFIALDFGIRCTIFIASDYAILLLVTTIEFVPYLKSTNGLHVSLTNYHSTAAFIAIAVALEAVNAYLIDRFYFRRIDLNVYKEVEHCFSMKHYALNCGIICSILFINPVFAFTEVTFHH